MGIDMREFKVEVVEEEGTRNSAGVEEKSSEEIGIGLALLVMTEDICGTNPELFILSAEVDITEDDSASLLSELGWRCCNSR